MDKVQKIKDLVKSKNLIYEDFAKKIGKSKPTVVNYFNRKSKIDIDTIEKIAEVLEVPVSYFFEGGAGMDNKDCLKYKKGYALYRKYHEFISETLHHYQHVFKYFYKKEILKPEYSGLRNIDKYDESLVDVLYQKVFDIYEVQELFIKSYYTKETDGSLIEYQKWEELEKKGKIKVRFKKDAFFPHLRKLSIIKIRDGYEEYFKKGIL